MPVPVHPITYKNRGPTRIQYATTRRWLTNFTGPHIRTEPQLRHALQKPEVFYIVPLEHR